MDTRTEKLIPARTFPATRSLALALGLAGITAIGAGLARADENVADTYLPTTSDATATVSVQQVPAAHAPAVADAVVQAPPAPMPAPAPVVEPEEPAPALPTAVEDPAPIATLEPGEFLWHPEVSTSGPVVVIVSLPEQRAHVYRNGLRIGVSTVSSGKPGHDTPTGVFPILQKRVEHYSNLYDNAPMPYMQRLTWDGVALHAGRNPGYPASHGCIRLPREFAELLFDATSHGTTVVVADESSHSASVVWPGARAPVDPYTGLEPAKVDVAALATIGSHY